MPARAALNKVAPLGNRPAPLLIRPKEYLAEVASTLRFMAATYGK